MPLNLRAYSQYNMCTNFFHSLVKYLACTWPAEDILLASFLCWEDRLSAYTWVNCCYTSNVVMAAMKVSQRSSVGRMDERTFFLFSDILMYAKPRLLDGAASGAVRAWGGVSHRSSSLVCCCIMPLHHCRVEHVFGQGHGADGNAQGMLFSVRHSDVNIADSSML